MPTPKELFDSLMAAAQENVQSAEDAKAKQIAQGNEHLVKTVTTIAEVLPKMAEQNKVMADRLAALETRGAAPRQTPTPEEDEYSGLGEFGIERKHIAPAIRAEVERSVGSAVEKTFEKLLGPSLRETKAIQDYSAKNTEFDVNRMNKFLAGDEEARILVQRASQMGAHELAIEYAEERRKNVEAATQEAKAQREGGKRERFVRQTRPDAQVLGGGAAVSEARAVKQTMTADQLQDVFARAEGGDWKPFERVFHNPGLPSEEEFQRLAQS